MTFCLNAKEEELLVKADSFLLKRMDGSFVGLYKDESDKAIRELSELRKRSDFNDYNEQISSLINKIRSNHPKW